MESDCRTDHNLGKCCRIVYILFKKLRHRWNFLSFPARQIIYNPYRVSLGKQSVGEMRTDKTRTARDNSNFSSIHVPENENKVRSVLMAIARSNPKERCFR